MRYPSLAPFLFLSFSSFLVGLLSCKWGLATTTSHPAEAPCPELAWNGEGVIWFWSLCAANSGLGGDKQNNQQNSFAQHIATAPCSLFTAHHDMVRYETLQYTSLGNVEAVLGATSQSYAETLKQLHHARTSAD